MSFTLHYIYDPLCGWCYAAEPLIEAAARAAPGGLTIRLHGGGLFEKTHLPPSKRAFIRQADAYIAHLSGQTFGSAYLDGLLNDPDTLYDSLPPIAAVLAAQALRPDSGLAMLRAIQHGHYRSGMRVVEESVLADLAADIGLERDDFLREYADSLHQAGEHIAGTRMLMRHAGAQGFPAFLLQSGERWQLLPHAQHYGAPAEFVKLVERSCSPA